MDYYIQRFLITVAVLFIIGLPRVIRNIRMPQRLDFLEIPPERLTEKQRAFFWTYDQKLQSLGYRPISTFQVKNLSLNNLSRAYLSPVDPATIMVSAISGRDGSFLQGYVEIFTRFRDGSVLTTKNTQVTSVFDVLPGRILQEYRSMKDPVKLKEQHDAKARSLAVEPLFPTAETFFPKFQESHERFCAHQVARGLLRFDPAAGIYRGTVWLGLRGIKNFLNPLADNFTLPKFLAGAAFATVLPLWGIIHPQPVLLWIQRGTGLAADASWLLLLTTLCTVAGVSIGWLFGNKSFIWAFLLGIIPAMLVRRGAGLYLWFGLWMPLVAHQVNVWRKRGQRLA